MSHRAVFEGLVVDENDRQVRVAYVGGEACYVVDDAGFLRHIPAEEVDRQVFASMKEQVNGHEDIISEQAAKMAGADDIFSRAMIMNQLRKLDEQFELIMHTGLPEEARAYLGMIGMKVVINIHGEVLRVEQPGMIDDSGED